MLIVAPSGSCTSARFIAGVGASVTLAHEGKDWVGRSPSAAEGSVEFRFREVFDSHVAGVAVDGTLAGVGRDHRPFAADGNGIAVAGETSGGAVVSAESTPNLANWILGRVSGRLTFNDGSGVGPVTCQEGSLTLRPPVGCELDANLACPPP
jgi:hypothetical protein